MAYENLSIEEKRQKLTETHARWAAKNPEKNRANNDKQNAIRRERRRIAAQPKKLEKVIEKLAILEQKKLELEAIAI